ncbi:MAG: hypothetical protein ACLGIN_10295, partial [Candidatus Sericytochromatia bacterium]
MRLGTLACHLGIGLVAGLVGTAAITASQAIDMKIRHRKPSKTPAKAVERVLEVTPEDEQAEQKLGQMAHWDYGTAWGAFRGLLGTVGVVGAPATILHWAAIQGTAMVMLPRLKVAPPVKEWGAKEIALEGLHHAVYAIAAGAAFDAMSRGVTRPEDEEGGHMLRNLALGAVAATGVKRFRGDRHEPKDEDGHLLRNLVLGTAAVKGVRNLLGGKRKQQQGSRLWGLVKAGLVTAGVNKLVKIQDRRDRGLVDKARLVAGQARKGNWNRAR